MRVQGAQAPTPPFLGGSLHFAAESIGGRNAMAGGCLLIWLFCDQRCSVFVQALSCRVLWELCKQEPREGRRPPLQGAIGASRLSQCKQKA